MGYRRIPVIHTIKFEGEREGLVVRMKSTTFGKMRRLVREMEAEDKDGDLMDKIAAELVEHLVSWNLVEEDDVTPVPADADGVDSLDFGTVMDILNGWLDQISGPDKELGKGSGSGASFPGRSLTMEAL